MTDRRTVIGETQDNLITAASYTFLLEDGRDIKRVDFNKSSGPDQVATIPLDATTDFLIGTTIKAKKVGSDDVVIVGAGVKAYGTVTLDTGASGSVDSITIDGIEVLGEDDAPVPYNTSLSQTATDVAAQITDIGLFTAIAVGAVITITETEAGPASNGFVIVSTCTTITTTDAPLANGTGITLVTGRGGNRILETGTTAFITKIAADTWDISYDRPNRVDFGFSDRTESAVAAATAWANRLVVTHWSFTVTAPKKGGVMDIEFDVFGEMHWDVKFRIMRNGYMLPNQGSSLIASECLSNGSYDTNHSSTPNNERFIIRDEYTLGIPAEYTLVYWGAVRTNYYNRSVNATQENATSTMTARSL